MKYDQLSVFESIVAKQHVRIEIDVPGEGGRGWRRSASSFELDSQQDLGESWRRDLQAGTAYMLQETIVKANDAHIDAKQLVCEPVCGGESEREQHIEQLRFGMATRPYVVSPCQGMAVRTSLWHGLSARRARQRQHAEVRSQSRHKP